ncbi:propanediol utilization protein [Chryseobacterium sp. Leaf405]|uniref:reprolysin-like metallopeptidase n=1 Tax=Chryseobacterium sp. Leaf405 TaxID=1736367 RepID=UPI0006F3E062|nr:zinc-dependent metalloprotease family protein [Chryseobacterium sp. Leaf405]KQT30888.1 propanediol utilization protein [Chryseobacterium sp. Leaf405]
MKKLITLLMCGVMGGTAFAQWSPASPQRGGSGKEISLEQNKNYKLNIDQIRSQLKNAKETGANAQAVEILLPTLRGKMERFAVYSFPVVVKELADQYQLGSYVGVGIDDPTKFLRFSLSPNDFQSMIIRGGDYEFIEPLKSDKTIYTVHAKSNPTGGKSFVCDTNESPEVKQQIDALLEKGKSFSNQPTDFSKMSDRKYRTMRLAVSVTGEYSQKFGGTVAGALAQVNATLTRVNGVFEKDFALHLNLQNFPGVIYLNAATDPYSNSNVGTAAANANNATGWNVQLQRTLTTNVGNANYDIGHLFGDSGGGGNAGCIGCVCINPTGDPATSLSKQKGSGFTSPADGNPSGDKFDIDYVAHEIGHQLGANHTFSHAIEGAGVNVEPGSGSTIMGYAGITGGPATDVQANSDAYFHAVSINQVQANLIAKTCDVEATTNNNPPVIAALPSYTIPKGTAFVLTASATDPENNPMTYAWEQVDSGMTAAQTINSTNIGTTTYGASFRSFSPTTSPTRYFPKLSSVLAGALDNSLSTWESTSQVARSSKFAVTVRDNNPAVDQQQTQYAEQNITVGADGPFRISNAGGYLYTNVTNTLTWDVAATTAAPYNSPNVMIDYSTDNGVTWTVLSASTPNDGSEVINIPASLSGQFVVVRVSSIGNVFYALKKMMLTTQVACGAAVSGVYVSNIATMTATANWAPVTGATSYVIRYKKTTDNTWQETTSTTTSVNITGLAASSTYEVQVSSVCGTQGQFSNSVIFSTQALTYCAISANNTPQYEYISNVKITNGALTLLNNPSGPSNYSNYTTNTALQPNLVLNTPYTFSMTITNPDYDTALAFIDYNNNGVFDSNERVFNYPINLPTGPISGNFTVPASAVTNQPLRMRVILYYAGQFGSTGASQVGFSLNSSYTGCGTFSYGEAEDYNVIITATQLSTSDVANPKDGIQIYPNPVSDVLNVTKVSDKATYKVYSAAGQLVKSGNISNGQINVSELVKGAYVITIEEKGKESFNSKFIKK